MISGVFVDRPRLAIVIAIITSIAGFLALMVIPVSQFPDIVPPQVQVTTRYPGRVRSRRGGDGGAAAGGSGQRRRPHDLHEVQLGQRRQLRPDGVVRAGHQPGHQHRQREQPRAGRAQPPAGGGAAPGRDRAEAVIGHPGVLVFQQRRRETKPAIHLQLRDHQRAGSAEPGVGRGVGVAVRGAGLLHARLVRYQPADRVGSGAQRHHHRHPAAERAGAGGPGRRASDQRRHPVPDQPANQGPPDPTGGVRQHHRPRQRGRLGAAGTRCRAGGAGRRDAGQRKPPERQPGGDDGHLPRPWRQRRADGGPCPGSAGRSRQAFPGGLAKHCLLQQQHLRVRHH